ncbi:MAG: hypothetical protein JJE55_14885 [Flavobacteriaceae bacterium]|nr:hypothetical protein [Flavobacteriaceae bacterium]
MESEVRNLWLVSDKAFYLGAYRAAFESIEKSWMHYSFDITEHHSPEAALRSLESLDPSYALEIVYLHISIPLGNTAHYEEGGIFGSSLRNRFPTATIILGTNFSQNFNIWKLIKTVKPNALISEEFNSPTDLPSQIVQLFKNPPFYCDTFRNAIHLYLQREINLDESDQMLLYELSKGTRMATLPTLMNYSISSIEKRKKHLKELFDVRDGDDWALILKARERGSI